MCYVSKMVSKLSITSNLLCVLLVDLGMFFFLSEQWLSNFLYNSSWTTNTGRLYGTDLHWQAVWDRLTLAGCMGQIPTDRI